MNGEIAAETAQFPEKEYINGIAVAVRYLFQGPRHVNNLRNFSPKSFEFWWISGQIF
jgi:hypothetical protein